MFCQLEEREGSLAIVTLAQSTYSDISLYHKGPRDIWSCVWGHLTHTYLFPLRDVRR